MPQQSESKTTKSLDELKDELVNAALRWESADIYVHPVLSRDQAVKVGVADLLDAIQNYRNALAPQQQAKNG